SIQEVVEGVAAGLGLDHLLDTVVGGEELRGVSGGQKRRVSFGEMTFAAESSFFFLDNITNGLDSASAESVVQLVYDAASVLGFGACFTLLQPPEKVYSLFQKVLVLTPDGSLAYFGPAEEAVAFFEEAHGTLRPAGMTSATFLQSCMASSSGSSRSF
ncbi:unnamed protein product, partial [Chrysoparadoxa australica]